MGGLYLLLEELGGEPFAAYKEFGRQIVVAALERVSHIHIHTHTHIRTHTYTHTYSHTHTHAQIITNAHTCAYTLSRLLTTIVFSIKFSLSFSCSHPICYNICHTQILLNHSVRIEIYNYNPNTNILIFFILFYKIGLSKYNMTQFKITYHNIT